MKELLSKKNLKNIGVRTAGTLAIPLAFVVIILIVCAANGVMILQTADSVVELFTNICTVTLTTLALSINLGSGRFDFSLGAMATLSSIISAKIAYAAGGGSTNFFVMLILCIIFGAVLGAASGGLYVLLKIPPIITSLGVTLIYEGICFAITGGVSLMAEAQMMSMRSSWILPLLITLLALAAIYILFDHTKFGRNYRALRDGQNVAVNTGIKEIPNAIVCYAVCGVLMGIVGAMQALRTTTIDPSVLNFGSIGIMFSAFLPMFIGGFIGRFSNDKLGYFLAAFCMALLSSMFSVFTNQINASTQSIITAVLLVVFLIFLNNEQTCKDLVTGRLFKKWIAQFKEWKAKKAAKKGNGGV